MAQEFLRALLQGVKSKREVQALKSQVFENQWERPLIKLLKHEAYQAKAAWVLGHAVEERPTAFVQLSLLYWEY